MRYEEFKILSKNYKGLSKVQLSSINLSLNLKNILEQEYWITYLP
jgi:hypothetical protein